MSQLVPIRVKSEFYLAATRDSIWRTVIALDLSARLVMRGQFNCAGGARASNRHRVDASKWNYRTFSAGPESPQRNISI